MPPLPALDCEIAVVGAGIGGVVAAVRAAELGRQVILIEARDTLGGTAMYSGGGVHIWGARSWEEYRRHCPLADPLLAKTLFDNFERLVDWLASTKAPGRYVTTTNRGLTLSKYQLGDSIAAPGRQAWFRHMGRRIEQMGGRLLMGARATELIRQGGRIAGIQVEHDGARKSVRADAVILANGGFQNDPEMLARYIGPSAAEFVSRGAPENRGDALRMALAAGAAETASMDTLYGHLVPAPPCQPDLSNYMDFLLLSAFYAEHAVVLNTAGRRFVDEGAGELSGLTINAAAQQPAGGLWLVMDQTIRRDFARYELPNDVLRLRNIRYAGLAPFLGLRRTGLKLAVTMDSPRFAVHRGALMIQADTLPALADALAGHGVDRGGMLQTIADYNAAVRDGAAANLAVPRTKAAHAIETGPFFALKVAVGVSMTYGGIRIDSQARVLRADSTPIEGLFAAPGAAGGVQQLHYAGALAPCAVYGLIAAEQAAASALHRTPM